VPLAVVAGALPAALQPALWPLTAGLALALVAACALLASRRGPGDAAADGDDDWLAAARDARLDAFFVLAGVGDLVFADANGRAEELLGAPAAELVGRRLAEVAPELAASAAAATYATVARTGVAVEEEVELRSPRIASRWLYQQVVPVARGVAVSAHDVTARRLAEQEVRDMAFRHAADLAAVADVTRGVPSAANAAEARVAVCDAAVEMCGALAAVLLEPGEAGNLCRTAGAGAGTDDVPPVPLGAHRSPVTDAFALGEPQFVPDLALDTAALPRIAGARAALLQPVLRDGLSVGVLAVVWDRPSGRLSPRTAAMMRLVASEAAVAMERADFIARLEELNRMLALQVEALRMSDQVKSDFVASVSHELRTPLTAILGYLDILREGIETPGERAEFLEIVDSSARRLLSLINDLLTLAGIEGGRMIMRAAPQDVRGLVECAVRDQAPAAVAAGVGVAVDLPAAAVDAQVDGERFSQVLANLVANAIKFTPPGGRVCVAVRADGDLTRVTVTDTGMGIPPDEADRLFERFFRGSNVRRAAIPGTGLGLAITRAIVEAHRGTVTCASRVGEGSTFTVTLPRAAAEAAPLAA
jgi:PAS domain S-box-containing protein